MPEIGVIVLAHGSRGKRGTSEVPEVLNRITAGLRLLLSQSAEVIGAALQFNHPGLEEAAELLIAQGVNQVLIAPYFLFSGRHLTEDIPERIERLKNIHPHIRFIVTDNLGLHEYFVQLMARRIVDACPGILPSSALAPDSAEAIEKQSMEIVEQFLPQDLPGGERIVTGRIVHASGDPFIAHLVKFSPSAVSSGLEAISRGCSIFTDVRMVAAGINTRLVKAHGCSVFCALEESLPEKAGGTSGTRSATAINNLEKRLNSSIVAIGNAPTALLALIDLIDKKNIAPALVIGMPVGFVQARELKAELMKREVPFITIEGTRGGSAMAVATVNALLRMVG